MSISANFPNVKPSLLLDFANAQQLPPSVTFTRATTAAYYNGSTTAMAEQNLILQSQTFASSPWSGTQLTVTENVTTAPDGTNTADSIVPNTFSTANHQFAQNVNLIANKTFTLSIYVKAFGYTKFAFREAAITGAYATFNLASSGSVIATASVAEVTILGATITSVGSGWFRVTISLVSTSSALSMGFFALNDTYTSGDPYAAGFATGDGTSGVYIWGCQLEQRATASAYTVTTTQAITNYVPVLLTAGGGQPRFDHNPTTSESRGLVIEEQRTNICIRSEDFSASGWTLVNATVSTNVGIAPDGTQTADLLIPNSTSSTDHSTYRSTGTLTGTYTTSCYAKAAGYNFFEIFDGTGANRLRVNLTDGSYVTTGSPAAVSVTAVGNGWYRCSFTRAISSAPQYVQVGAVSDSAGSAFSGNGFGGVLIWGAQQELGAFATSYIPTTTAAATRAADLASMTGANFSSWFNNAQGTFYAQANLSNGGRYFNTYKSSSSFQLEGVQGPTYYESFVYDGAVQAQIQITAAQFTSHRVATAYAVNDIAGCVDAGTVGTDTTAVLPIGLDTLNINAYTNGGPYGSGTIKKIAYYPLRLTNAQLQALTS